VREIKFRAWDKKKKYMHTLENHGLKWVGIEDIDPSFQGNCYSHISGWFDGILMQYTGIKDSKGKEIYEGDIVKYQQPKLFDLADVKDLITTVEYINGAYWPIFLSEHHLHDFDDRPLMITRLEVIGNIYEHKHLLETVKE